MPLDKARYEAHINSSKWKNTCAAVRRLHGNRCQKCGHGSARLEVHHINYERLGDERLSDLMLLCPDCHAAEDKKREKASKEKSAAALRAAHRDARYRGYMKARFGEYWEDHETEDIADEFDEWLRQKEEEEESGG